MSSGCPGCLKPGVERHRAFLIPDTAPYLRLEQSGSVIVDIHVVPNASATAIDGLHDGALKVRLHAPPVDGKANLALLRWLAKTLAVTRSHVTLIRGDTSRRKQLRVDADVVSQAQ